MLGMKGSGISLKTIFYIICVALITVNLSLWPISSILALIHLAIMSVIIMLSVITFRYNKNRVFDVSRNLKEFFDSNTGEILEAVPMPVVIVNSSKINNILFYNSQFKKSFFDRGYCSANNFDKIFPKDVCETIFEKDQINLTVGSDEYRVYIRKFYEFIILYFETETLYCNLKQKYLESRLCVGYLFFDNQEELKQSIADEKVLHISLSVEDTLQKWISSVCGAFEKISDGKYIAIFEEKYLKKFISEKFNILEKIHKLKADENKCATVSMGISRGFSSIEEAKNEATGALYMALGRGGDQVAIKNKNSYEFFGGTSGGLEKRSKVRTRVVARDLLGKIDSADKVLLMGHKFSDFDSVGSAVALRGICAKASGKESRVVLNKSQTLALNLVEYLEFHSGKTGDKIFVTPEQARNMVTPNTLLIILDTHSFGFLEDTEVYQKCNNVVVIDHHRMNVEKISNTLIFFHEPFASSTCEMVAEMVQYMNDRYVKNYEADALLAGIMLDTKNFSLKTGMRTFEAAAYLKKKGADVGEVKRMFANSLDSYKLRYKIIEKSRIIGNCAVAAVDFEDRNLRLACAQAADELLNIKNVKASFVLFQNDGIINISSRSMGDINVQVIMEKFGGGGHQTMAAAQVNDGSSLDEVKQKLTELIDEIHPNAEIKERMEK